MTIQFGTDGWRAIISDEFTFANLRLVAQAVADYLLEDDGKSHEAVVGFDTRFLSDRYAAEVACVLAANGIATYLTRSDAPTPAISYAVVHQKATLGIMITASHNPPRYNGIKLKADFGGAALPDQTKHIETLLNNNVEQGREPKVMDYQKALDDDMIRRFNPAWAYYQHLGEIIDLDVISEGELRIVSDAMYGSARKAIADMLARTRSRVHEIRSEMNPGFGGIHPEPVERYLTALKAAIRSHQADLGLATDGDGDRIGAMDALGNFVDPHHIFALALRYLVEVRGWKGKVVKSLSTTSMVNRLAEKHGLELIETPVGFNHIADHMLKGDVLIGGEESGGLSIKGHIPEGDGVLMGLLLMEIIARSRTPLHELVASVQEEVGPTHYTRRDIPLQKRVDKTKMTKRLREDAPSSIGGQKVQDVKTLDGVKYELADGSWLLIRPSGTEPVLRVYAEGRDRQILAAMLAYGEEVAST